MQLFGFEQDPFPPFDPAAHGIDDSHCKNLRPKTELRDRKSRKRLRHRKTWEQQEEDGSWVPVKDPDYMEYVVMDDDSDAAYYLHLLSRERGHGVDDRSVVALEEPMRSAVIEWTGLGRLGDEYRSASPPYSMWVDEELGFVVVWEQMWAYGVTWISPEGLALVRERVRQMKETGQWREPHPNGATMVFG